MFALKQHPNRRLFVTQSIFVYFVYLTCVSYWFWVAHIFILNVCSYSSLYCCATWSQTKIIIPLNSPLECLLEREKESERGIGGAVNNIYVVFVHLSSLWVGGVETKRKYHSRRKELNGLDSLFANRYHSVSMKCDKSDINTTIWGYKLSPLLPMHLCYLCLSIPLCHISV